MQDHDRTPQGPVGADHVRTPAVEDGVQIGELVGNRLDEPVSEDPDQAATPAPVPAGRLDRAHVAKRALLVDALEREEPEALLLHGRAHGLAAVEGHVVPALAERHGDAHLRQQVRCERPEREEDASRGHRCPAVTAEGGPESEVRRSSRRRCPPK